MVRRDAAVGELSTALEPLTRGEAVTDGRVLGPAAADKTTLAKCLLREPTRTTLDVGWVYVDCFAASTGAAVYHSPVADLGRATSHTAVRRSAFSQVSIISIHIEAYPDGTVVAVIGTDCSHRFRDLTDQKHDDEAKSITITPETFVKHDLTNMFPDIRSRGGWRRASIVL